MQEITQPTLQNEAPSARVNQSMPARVNEFKYPEERKAPVQYNLTPSKINPLILVLLIIIFLLGLGIILWKFVFGENVDFLNAFRAAPSPTQTIVVVTPSIAPPKEYVEGLVLVAFKDDLTFRQAINYLDSLGFKYENQYVYQKDGKSYIRRTGGQDSLYTLEEKIGEYGFFKVFVPVGKEKYWMSKIKENTIIKYVELSAYAH